MSAPLIPRIQKTDTGMNSGIAAIDNSLIDCEKIRLKAEALRSQLTGEWTGAAGATFNRKLDEWTQNYYLLLQELGKIKDLVQVSNAEMNTTEDDAGILALNSFGDVSDGVYNRLT
ncbi:WXG100 family type VII secretion target [Lentzea albidocapillata]|uniref:Proteins of 100 residues with WXG n=1 Tax=Lentzea albidocapillata TaxID=40571 RepID=A0A1W2DGD3_9PSEU|nr:WXG100 family type VII secretion target [Lentzea albidocapillata]SMC96543.1 Proteins of 100 residues with WXG [Lentzea albidocapillata]